MYKNRNIGFEKTRALHQRIEHYSKVPYSFAFTNDSVGEIFCFNVIGCAKKTSWALAALLRVLREEP